MATNGGRPPSDWQSPDDQPDEQSPAGDRPPAYPYRYGGYGPPGVPSQPPPGKGPAIAALALGKVETDPRGARKFTKWAWICACAAPVISIGLFALYFSTAPQP